MLQQKIRKFLELKSIHLEGSNLHDNPKHTALPQSCNHIYIYLLTAIGLSPGGSGYFTCKQNMKLVTNKFKSGGQHEKHVVATWNVGNHLSICL